MTIAIKSFVSATINCKGGIALLFGEVVKETEKAVQIHYAIEPVFVGASGSSVTVYNRQAWIPKSQMLADNRGAFEIKRWFANSAMKSYNIKPYQSK